MPDRPRTPGPWFARALSTGLSLTSGNWRAFRVVDEHGAPVPLHDNNHGGGGEEAAGNALLMAASPDLFDCCRDMLAQYESLAASEVITDRHAQALRAALAKAKGNTVE